MKFTCIKQAILKWTSPTKSSDPIPASHAAFGLRSDVASLMWRLSFTGSPSHLKWGCILKWRPPQELHSFCLKWVKVSQSCPTLFDPMDYTVHGILQARILEWVALPFAKGSSQPRDQTQVSRIAGQILYQLSHQGSPRILEWVAYPFSSGSSLPRNWTRISCIAGRFFTSWATSEAETEASRG